MQAGQDPPKTAGQVDLFRGNFLEMLLRKVVEAVNGVFVHGLGGAFDQLRDWATTLWNAAADAMDMLRRLLERIGGTIFGTIEDAVDFVGDAIKGTANTLGNLMDQLLTNAGAVIGNIPQALVSGLTGAISAINSAIGAATNFIQAVIDGITSGLRGIPIIGALIPDLSRSVKQQKVDQQNFTISGIVSDARNPDWVCRYPISDVTYPEFYNSLIGAGGITEGASAGTAHTHNITTSNVAVGTLGWSVGQNESRGSYISVNHTTVHDTIGTIVWKDGGSLNNVYLEMFKEAEDGSLTRIYSQEFSGSITTITSFFEFTLPSRLVVQSGERFLLRIRNSSSVANLVRVIGAARLLAASPEGGFTTVGSSLTNKTSYTIAEAAAARTAGVTLNWFMLAAKSLPMTDRSFSDDANRLAIGGLWVRQSSTASLLDIYEDRFGYTGALDGDQSALYIHRCSRDVNKVEADLHINSASTVRLGIMLHCSRDFEQVVYLGVNSTSAKIYSGPIDSLTERASLATGGTGRWTLFYEESADKYAVLKENAPIGLEWTSVGSTVEHGADYRFGGFRIESDAGESAGGLDDWTLRDWYVAVPATIAVPRMEATSGMPDTSVTGAAAPVATRMTSTSAMSSPTVTAECIVNVATMSAASSMPSVGVFDGSFVPELATFTSPGVYTYTLPAGAVNFDIITIGGGASSQGSGFGSSPAGINGTWASTTVTLGSLGGATTLSVTVGAGGPLPPANTLPNPGASSVVRNAGVVLVSGAGGPGAAWPAYGTPVGDVTVNGQTYVGGAATTWYNQPGNAPGGGGAGRYEPFASAWPGAPGAVYIRAY